MGWTERDFHVLGMLAPPSERFLPWSLWSMRPANVMTLLSEIKLNRRTSVLECGPGISTFFAANLLRETGGRLCAIEHDAAWAEWMADELRAQGHENVELIRAPLAACEIGWDGGDWYDMGSVERGLGDSRFDLLVVDGPPAFEESRLHARYPALPALLPWLEEDAAVMLDDAWRPGERDVIARWEEETPFRFKRSGPNGGLAVGRKPGFTGFDVAESALTIDQPRAARQPGVADLLRRMPKAAGRRIRARRSR